MNQSLSYAVRLRLELRLIVDVLPLAAAARSEVEAPRVGPQSTRHQELLETCLREVLLRLKHTCSDAVTWYGPRHEHDVTVLARQRLAAIRKFFDLKLYDLSSLKNGVLFVWYVARDAVCSPQGSRKCAVRCDVIDSGRSAVDEAHGLYLSVPFYENADKLCFHRR